MVHNMPLLQDSKAEPSNKQKTKTVQSPEYSSSDLGKNITFIISSKMIYQENKKFKQKHIICILGGHLLPESVFQPPRADFVSLVSRFAWSMRL